MRKYSKSLISSIFLGALAISFVIFGVGDIFKGSTDNTVFSVGSNKVSSNVFTREYRNAVKQTHTTLSPEESHAVAQQTLDRMTLETALDNLTNNLGLTVSDARVEQQIQATSAFFNPSGSFDPAVFVRRIGDVGYTVPEFKDLIKRGTSRNQMLGAVQLGFAMPPDYARAIFAYVNEARAAEYVVLTPASVGEVPPPSETVLAGYVKAHPERFSTPEYRSVDYAAINADDIATKIKVTDAQIQEEIDANRSTYIVAEKRSLEQIQFPSEDAAKAAAAQLKGGKTFDALAGERKLKPEDYKLGDVVEADLDKARADIFFKLPEGATSDPVKANFGWVLMHNVKITAGSAKSHDDIRKLLQQRLAVDKMTDIANAYTDALGGGASMEEAAHHAGMRFIHVAALDDQGLTPDGKKGLDPVNPELLAAIFKAEVGDEGDPFPTQDGLHYFAIKVNGTTPPKVRPLEAVHDQASARWVAEKKVELLRAKATDLAKRATQARSLKEVAASLGAPVQTSAALNRGTSEGLFNSIVVRQLYATPAGAAIAAPTMDGNYIIARVSGIVHPLPPEGDLAYRRGVNQLGSEIAADLVISMGKAVQQRDGLTINQKLVDTATGNSGSGS